MRYWDMSRRIPAALTGSLVMKRHVVFAVCFSMFLVAPLYAGEVGSCEQCRNAVQQELAKCIESAISQEDKKSCMEKKDPRMKACDKGMCKVVRGNDHACEIRSYSQYVENARTFAFPGRLVGEGGLSERLPFLWIITSQRKMTAESFCSLKKKHPVERYLSTGC